EWQWQQGFLALRPYQQGIMIRIKAGEQTPGGSPRVDLQSAGRMRVSRHGALCLGPLHYGRGPRRPAFDPSAFGTRVSLLLEVKQANMSQRLGAKPANLQIVLHHGKRF